MEIKLLFLEIQVGIAVMVVLLARLAMRKLPSVYSYMLWLLVFARLLIPVSIESPFALMPSAAGNEQWLEERFVQTDMAAEGESAGNIAGGGAETAIEADGTRGNGNVSGTGDVNANQRTEGETGNSYSATGMQGTSEPEAGGPFDVNFSMSGAVVNTDGNYERGGATGKEPHTFRYKMRNTEKNVSWIDKRESPENRQPFTGWNLALLLIWAVGAAAILLYNGTALLLVKRRVRGAEHLRDNIYTGSRVKAPFTLGIFSPEIYLPPELEGVEREYIICHEQVHIRRKDYLVKNLAFLLTAVHWFNPFVWAAFYFMERDMEMSCDETVIRKMGQEIKKQYSQSLLNFAKGKCPAAVTPITFGENSVKQRVTNVLAYKTASRRAAVLGTAVLFLLAAAIFTVRSDARENAGLQSEDRQDTVTVESVISVVKEHGSAADLIQANFMLIRRSPYTALEYWARAYVDRDGDTLFQLAADEENFRQWDKVMQKGDSFVFGDSSPWPWEYDYEIYISPEGSTAEITFPMRTSVPEIYLVKETVRITEQDGLYCVDYKSTKDNYRIGTAREYAEAYGQSSSYDDNGGDSAGTGYDKLAALYDASFYRAILIQLLEGGNSAFYQSFADPVASARELLHLGAGTGEVTEWHMVSPVRLRSADADLPEWASVMAPDWLMASSEAGAGSQVVLTYTFAEDSSQVEIPMELKEESQGIWGLVGGGIREVYNMLDEPEMIDYDAEGRARGVYVIELSNYGIYRLGAHSGLTCLWAGEADPEAVTKVYEDKLYIFQNPEYAEENSEDEAESVFVWDLLTEELHREHLAIPQNYEHIFPKTDFRVEGGFAIIDGFGKNHSLPLENRNQTIWNRKTFRQMSREEKQAYGIDNREYLLLHPGTLVQLSVREADQTSAFVDLDGDGISEQVILSANPDRQGQYWGYDSYRLQAGESAIMGEGSRLYNDIWAYSPDGKEIILALYEDGPSGDPRTYLFGYEKGELTALGEFGDDIRECRIEDGVISGCERCDVMQTDAVYTGWRIGDSGLLERVSQQAYDFALLNEIELLKELPVQNVLPPEEEGVYHGIFRFTIAPQTVRFLQTDSTFSWVYLEAEDGSRGWFQMDGHMVKELGKQSYEVFNGLLLSD